MARAGLVAVAPANRPAPVVRGGTPGTIVLLQVFAITLFVFPSDTVIRAIGASGYVASLVALTAFGLWLVSRMIGFHGTGGTSHPLRLPIAALWVASLASFVVMNMHHRSGTELLAADRWLLELAAITGIVFVAADGLRTLRDITRVLRVVVAGGAFCAVVGAAQYWAHYDITRWLRDLPGFTVNLDDATITSRGAVSRVTGTAIHPIELGVVAGMLLPLAIYLLMYDDERSARRRWVPVLCILAAIPISVSRSGVVSAAVAIAVFIVLLPPTQRVVGLLATPVALAAVFMAAPGVIRTLSDFFGAGSADRSVATRIDDYPLVERLVTSAPLFGRGGGTYIAANALEIFDNEYYKAAVEIGLIGLGALVLYLGAPFVTALVTRRRSDDPSVRTLCGALAGAAAATVVCSVTFDSMSFPMFVGLQSLVAGSAAAVWRLGQPASVPRGVP